MRPSAKAALAVAGMFVAFEPVNAGQLNMPTEPQSAIQHIKFETPTLAPMAYTMFSQRYKNECRTRPLFRGGSVRLNAERWADLKQVNQTVNRSIIPESKELEVAALAACRT